MFDSLFTDPYAQIAILFGMAFLLRATRRCLPVYVWLSLPGTLAHELLHLLAALLVFARPTGFSIWPRKRAKGGYELGHVLVQNPNIWQQLVIGLAPFLLLPIAWGLFRLPSVLALPVYGQLIRLFLIVQCLFSAWPSPQDWRLAWRGLFLLGILCAGIAFGLYKAGLWSW